MGATAFVVFGNLGNLALSKNRSTLSTTLASTTLLVPHPRFHSPTSPIGRRLQTPEATLAALAFSSASRAANSLK